jgi:spore coat polysaccharide biosynthesis protein SpsF
MKTVAIIQARINSTRLSRKMLLPLAGKPAIQHVFERVQRAKGIDQVVLAIPQSDIRDLATSLCDVFPYVGDEADLVGRYCAAAEAYRADLVIRIPGDNPCIDPTYLEHALEHYRAIPSVYYSNTTAECAGLWFDGLGCEVASVSRWKWLDARTYGEPDYREHPHQYFLDHRCYSLPKADIRLDLNTAGDYRFLSDIFDHFGHNGFTTPQLAAYFHATMKGDPYESLERPSASRNLGSRA